MSKWPCGVEESKYVVLGRYLHMDRDFENEEERKSVLMLAYADGICMLEQGFGLVGFYFRDGKLKVMVGDLEETNMGVGENVVDGMLPV